MWGRALIRARPIHAAWKQTQNDGDDDLVFCDCFIYVIQVILIKFTLHSSEHQNFIEKNNKIIFRHINFQKLVVKRNSF